jgi:cobalt/nickel transport system permease protein
MEGTTRHHRGTRKIWLLGLLVALLLAGVASYYASGAPDGLNRVAADRGFDKGAKKHDLADSPLAGYGVRDVDDARLSGGLAGVIGVAGTLVVGSGVFWLVRRRGSAHPAATEPKD